MRRAALIVLGVILACSRADGPSAGGSATTAAPAPAAATGSGSAGTPSSGSAAPGSGTDGVPEILPPGSAASTAAGSGAQREKADPSRLELEGKAIQGAVLRARVEPGTRGIKFPGHRVVIAPDGRFLIAFFRNAPPKETLTVTFPDGAVLEHEFAVEQRGYAEDKIDHLPESFVKLEPEAQRKLTQANGRLDAVRMGYGERPYYLDGFIWPAVGKITSHYGQPRILNGTDGGIHWGVDIAAPLGTPVRAPAGGKVLAAERDVPLAGNVLILGHGHGLSSTFLHLRGFTVKVGDEVKQGATIANVGMTGRTNGPHLDWRMSLFEIQVNPELLAPPMPAAGR